MFEHDDFSWGAMFLVQYMAEWSNRGHKGDRKGGARDRKWDNFRGAESSFALRKKRAKNRMWNNERRDYKKAAILLLVQVQAWKRSPKSSANANAQFYFLTKSKSGEPMGVSVVRKWNWALALAEFLTTLNLVRLKKLASFMSALFISKSSSRTIR